MSETTETTPATEPEPTPTPAPESAAPEAEAQEQTPEEQRAARDKEDRRIAQLRARLGAAEREQARQAAELAFWRQQGAQAAQAEETPEQRHQRERAQIRAEVEAEIRTQRFHEQGAAAYGDWKQRCDDLVNMGADAGFAAILVDMPDGAKVAGALANDPDEVVRIRNLPTERARSIALGKYAAMLDDHQPARSGSGTAPQVTRAPAPIRPVTGRASPQFNEYTADGNTLVERYMKQDMEKRMRR